MEHGDINAPLFLAGHDTFACLFSLSVFFSYGFCVGWEIAAGGEGSGIDEFGGPGLGIVKRPELECQTWWLAEYRIPLDRLPGSRTSEDLISVLWECSLRGRSCISPSVLPPSAEFRRVEVATISGSGRSFPNECPFFLLLPEVVKRNWGAIRGLFVFFLLCWVWCCGFHKKA